MNSLFSLAMGSVYAKYFEMDPLEEDKRSGKGPLGLGDPEDRNFRPYELTVHIPAVIKMHLERDKCKVFTENLDACVEDSIFPFYFCSQETSDFNNCISTWDTPEFRDHMQQVYINYRSTFRATGRRRLFNALRGMDIFPSESSL